MATSFKGWLDSWNGWGGVTDPNALRGSASMRFTASLQVNAGEMQGAAEFSITASGSLLQLAGAPQEPPRYYSADNGAAQRARLRQQLEEDEVILAIVQQFVMEA